MLEMENAQQKGTSCRRLVPIDLDSKDDAMIIETPVGYRYPAQFGVRKAVYIALNVRRVIEAVA